MSAHLLSLSLDSGWTCDYFEPELCTRGPARAEPVASLAAWVFDGRRADGQDAWLERPFTLRQVDFCVSYLLLIGSAPAGAAIHINDRPVGVYAAPGPDDPSFELEITLLVALGLNRVAFRVARDMPGAFSGLRLRMTPC